MTGQTIETMPHAPFARRHAALLSLILGALAACGFAPLELWPLTLACVAAWMWLVHDAPTRKAALWRGWVFGVGHFTINDNWFQHAFDFQDKMPPALGYAAPLALALYLAVFPALAAGLAWPAARRSRRPTPDSAFVLTFAAAWTGTEWLRSVLFTGYAWDPLGVIWVPVQAVAAAAAWVGTYALSGLTVALAGALLLLFARRRWLALVPVALIAASQPFSYRAADPAAPRDAPRLVVVQPNVPQDERGESDGEAMLSRLSALSGTPPVTPGAAPRLVLWPEGVVRDFLEDGYPGYVYGMQASPWSVRRRIARLLGPGDIVLTGGNALQFDADGNVATATNSVFAIDAAARIIGRYDKAHLVPFGEYLPLPWLLKPIGLARLVPGEMDFADGPGPAALTLPGFGAIGVQVCYEIIFSGEVTDRAHRPRLLFNPSNDAWFGAWGTPQFLAQARMRAIEEGLPVVRATPTGISAVIAADGRLIAAVPHRRGGAIDVPLPAPLPPTLFSRVGNGAAAAVALALLLAAVAIRIRRR